VEQVIFVPQNAEPFGGRYQSIQLSPPPPLYESLFIKFPQVLECGFYPSAQKRDMSHTPIYKYFGKLKMCIACDLIVRFSWVIFWDQKK